MLQSTVKRSTFIHACVLSVFSTISVLPLKKSLIKKEELYQKKMSISTSPLKKSLIEKEELYQKRMAFFKGSH